LLGRSTGKNTHCPHEKNGCTTFTHREKVWLKHTTYIGKDNITDNHVKQFMTYQKLLSIYEIYV